MKILLVHDHIFLTQEEQVYSNVFSYDIIKRYIDIFSEVTFVARCREVEDTMNFPLASGKGVKFIFLQSISSLHSYFGLRSKYKKFLQNLIAEHDGVIVRLPSEFGLMSASIAKKMHKKYIGEVVGCAWDAMWHYGGLQSKIYAPFFYLKMRKAIYSASYVSYVTEIFLQKRYPAARDVERTISISDVELGKSDKSVLQRREEKIEYLSEKVILGTIANLDLQYKGLDIVIRLLAESLPNNFEYHIAGAGDKSRYSMLTKRLGVSDKVYFEGVIVGKERVEKWLDNVDIYIQPSRVEGLPRALIEAMSRGCPSIGSSVGGIPELLDTKMLFEHKDLSGFIQLIIDLYHHKDEMKKQAKRNYLKAKDFENRVLSKKRKIFFSSFRNTL